MVASAWVALVRPAAVMTSASSSMATTTIGQRGEAGQRRSSSWSSMTMRSSMSVFKRRRRSTAAVRVEAKAEKQGRNQDSSISLRSMPTNWTAGWAAPSQMKARATEDLPAPVVPEAIRWPSSICQATGAWSTSSNA